MLIESGRPFRPHARRATRRGPHAPCRAARPSRVAGGSPASSRIKSEADTLFLTSLFPDNRLGSSRKTSRRPGAARSRSPTTPFRCAIPTCPRGNVRGTCAPSGCSQRFDLVIAVSDASRADLLGPRRRNNDLPRAKHCRHPRGPHAVRRTPAARSSRHLPGRKNVLYVSRLKQVKNHASLLAGRARNSGTRAALSALDAHRLRGRAARIGGHPARSPPARRPGLRHLGGARRFPRSDLHAAYRDCILYRLPLPCGKASACRSSKAYGTGAA